MSELTRPLGKRPVTPVCRGPSPQSIPEHGKEPPRPPIWANYVDKKGGVGGTRRDIAQIMAYKSQWARCSSTNRRIGNETGSDPGDQQGAKYRIRGLSKGMKRPLRSDVPNPRHCTNTLPWVFATWGCYPGEIQCQFIILGKSSVSSSFLPKR